VKVKAARRVKQWDWKTVVFWNALAFSFYNSLAPPFYSFSLQSSLVPGVCIHRFCFLVGFVTPVLSAFLLQVETFEKKTPALSYCQLVGWFSVVSPATTLATQEVQLTRLSAQPCIKVFTELMVLLTRGQGLQSQQYYSLSRWVSSLPPMLSSLSISISFAIIQMSIPRWAES
jgi:hypothetical protein